MTEVNYNDYSMETREKRQIYYSKSYFKKRKKKEIFIPNEKDVSLEYNSEREIIAIETLKQNSSTNVTNNFKTFKLAMAQVFFI